jgi:hypothetical protein
MRLGYAIFVLGCTVASCGGGMNDDCAGPEYTGPRSLVLLLLANEQSWETATLSVGGACTNPRCLNQVMGKCDFWRFDTSGSTGSQCDLTLTAPNGAQCHKTLKVLYATTDCPGMNSGFKLSELEGDDCTAVDAQ